MATHYLQFDQVLNFTVSVVGIEVKQEGGLSSKMNIA
jgi:hypothetical protein